MTAKSAVVIGGGIAGCSTAHALARRGYAVTLLERSAEIASGASGNPLAMLYPRLSGSDTSSEFAMAAYQFSLALYQSLGLSAAVFNACGMLQLGFNDKEQKRIQCVAAQDYPHHIVHYLNAAAASAIANIEIKHGALYFPQAAWVQPQALCNALTQHQNISIKTLTNVLNVLNKNNKFIILTQGDMQFEADIVVIANAADSQRLIPENGIQTRSVRGQVSIVRPSTQSRDLRSIVCSDGYFSPAAYTFNNEQVHCLGATFENMETAADIGQACKVTDEDHIANLNKLVDISPALLNSVKNQVCGGRASIRCTAVDYWPVAGQLMDSKTLQQKPPRPNAAVSTLPWIPGLYVNTAHGSKGFTTAPLCAEMIACHADSKPLPISTALAGLLNPNRFLLKQMGLKRLARMIDTPGTT